MQWNVLYIPCSSIIIYYLTKSLFNEKCVLVNKWNVCYITFLFRYVILYVYVQGVHKVSLQFQKFFTKANEKTDKWKLLQNQTYIYIYIYIYFFFLPHLIHLYMDIISCTKHIKTVLNFLHDRSFPQMFLKSTSSFIEHCPCFHEFLVPCTMMDMTEDLFWVCWLDLVSINHDTHCAFSWGVVIV